MIHCKASRHERHNVQACQTEFDDPVASFVTDSEDGNGLKLEQICHVLVLCLKKSPKKLISLALPDKIHLISSSKFFRSVLCMGKGTK